MVIVLASHVSAIASPPVLVNVNPPTTFTVPAVSAEPVFAFIFISPVVAAISALYVVDAKLKVTVSVNILGNAIKDMINKNFIILNLNCDF